MDLKKLKDMDDLELTNKIAEAEARRNVIIAKTQLVLKQKALSQSEKTYDNLKDTPGVSLSSLNDSKKDMDTAKNEVKMWQDEVNKAVDIHSKSNKALVQTQKEAHEKATTQNKAFWTKQKDDATKALDSIASAQKKLMDAGNFKGIDSAVVKSYKENAKKLKEAEKELKVYDSSSKQDFTTEIGRAHV